MSRNRCPMLLVGDTSIAWQQMRQTADLAPTHRIGLPGERKRPATGSADFSSGKMKIDYGQRLAGADRGLVHPHTPQRERTFRLGKPESRSNYVARGNPANAGRARRLPLQSNFARGIPAARVIRNELFVHQALAHHHAQHCVEERQIGAGPYREMEVCKVCGLGSARVCDDHANLIRRGLLALLDSPERDRMAPGGIASDDQKRIGNLEVLVARWRAVRAQRCRVG
jgi:hypothetical protein